MLLAALLLLWLARAQIAARFAQNYFSSHGIESSVEIGTLGLSGGSGRFALGPRYNPTISADSIELFFDPLSWIPRVVEVRLVGPVVRARLDESGKVRLEALQDWIDSPALWRALAGVGLDTPPQLSQDQRDRVAAVLCKADPSTNGMIRGARHIMTDDSDINATRHARALVGGVVAGAVGRTDVFVSGGAEHQGPDGWGPLAVIALRPGS